MMFAIVPNTGHWVVPTRAIGNRKSVVCHVPIPRSVGDLDTASGCDIGDRKNLEEKPARIVPAELGVSDSFLVEQWYH